MSDLQTLSLEERLIEQLEKIQKENELFAEELSTKDSQLSEALQRAEEWKQNSQELQTKVSTISSENLKLRQELQKKTETIVSLNQWIAKLHESDIVLTENEALKKQVSDIRDEVDQKKKRLQDEYDSKNAVMQADRDEAQKLKNELEEEKSRQKDIIQTRSNELYEKKLGILYSSILAALIFFVGIVILEGTQSEAFINDLKLFFIGIKDLILSFVNNVADDIIKDGKTWKSYIIICVKIIVVIIVGICLYYILSFVQEKICKRFLNYIIDISFVLVILSGIIICDQDIKLIIDANLIAIFIVMCLCYVGLRWFLKHKVIEQWLDG